VIPEPERSVYAQAVSDRSMFSAAWIESGTRWFDPAEQATLAREFLFHDCELDALLPALKTVELFDTRHLIRDRGRALSSYVASGRDRDDSSSTG
jgi:hypothetical protein